MLTRREWISAGFATAIGLAPSRAFAGSAPTAEIAALEQRNGGRLGVAILDLATGEQFRHRADELFPIGSTYKFLAAAFVLERVDQGRESLQRRINFDKSKLVTYSPATEKHVAEGMTLEDICAAAITLSDNTAGNLLLEALGGPESFTRIARDKGDIVTRIDRIETELNEATPGDPRDTTSPDAMAAHLRRYVVGDGLSSASRERLAGWLVANTTGGKRLRARAPAGWKIGDKTGTSGHGVTNDIGVFWPPTGAPIVVAAYYAESAADLDARQTVLAEVGGLVVGLRGG